MTYRVWAPQPPSVDLKLLNDHERKIFFGPTDTKRAVWDLGALQIALSAAVPIKVSYTEKAQAEMKDKLNWSHGDAISFLKQLSTGRFNGSEWCYTPNGKTAYACDSYVMGYSRVKGIEAQALMPWVYVKFTVTGPNLDRIAVFSAHPEGQY
jgi:hypothetical protein